MADLRAKQVNEPNIALAQTSVNRTEDAECWRVSWLVENCGIDFLEIESVRLPHEQFKSGEHRFTPPLVLSPCQKTEFTVSVRCNEPAGVVTENAFLIFQVSWLGERWRIFARVRVVVTEDGRPETETESITTQKVGFSGVAT